MKVEISEKNKGLKFDFILGEGDGRTSSGVIMGEKSVNFKLPPGINKDVHPDLISLAIILCCHPFVNRELHLPFPVSRRFLDEARKVISRYIVVAEVDESLEPRRAPINSRPGLAFSGGVDSTAALSVMPSNTVPCFMKRPMKKGSLYNSGAAMSSCEILSQLGYDVQIIECDIEYLREPVGFPTDLAHATPVLLLADFLGLGTIGFGTVLESAYGIGHERYRNYARMSHWRFFGSLFSAAGLPISLPVAGISEVGTSIIVEKSPIGLVAQSCIRGNWQEPCWNCWKCFRKGLLGSALGIYKIERLGIEKMLATTEVRKKLTEVPISHENVISYSLDRTQLNKQHSLLFLKEMVQFQSPLGMLEKWFSPSIELVHEKWKKSIRNKILRILEPMSEEEEAAIENWSNLEGEDDINQRKRMIEDFLKIQN